MSNCLKKRYRDRIAAQLALVSIRSGAKRQEARICACPFCRGWHLTSQGDSDE